MFVFELSTPLKLWKPHKTVDKTALGLLHTGPLVSVCQRALSATLCPDKAVVRGSLQQDMAAGGREQEHSRAQRLQEEAIGASSSTPQADRCEHQPCLTLSQSVCSRQSADAQAKTSF
uniref:Uncharacterized protein n=1 Tax=Knipowitschia caucasica TaxID=637954 RepID=A0AAV2JBF7_KNICA